RAGAATADASVRRLFSATAVVYAVSCAAVGIGTTLTDPRTACTYRPRLPGEPPAVPSPDPTPSSAPMARNFPSPLASSVEGYHAVGMRPRRRARPGESPTSYTATAFAPPSAMYSVRP